MSTNGTPTLRELGIGLVPYSPLGRGLLTGALDAQSLDRTDFHVVRYPRFMGEARDANLALVGALARLAEAKGRTAAQLALAWVLGQGHDVVPIPGTKRVRYLEENIAALEFRVDSDDLAAIEAAVPVEAVVDDRYADMTSIDR